MLELIVLIFYRSNRIGDDRRDNLSPNFLLYLIWRLSKVEDDVFRMLSPGSLAGSEPVSDGNCDE